MRLILLVLLIAPGAPAWAAGDEWARAAAAIKRLPPSAFPELPAPIRADLARRGCTVPQVWSESKPHNVIRGQFIKRGIGDWAVLCSRRGRSSILIFHGKHATPAAELAQATDVNWLQAVTGDGRVGYSRIISPVGRREILYYRDAFGGPLPPDIDREGIEDYFEGKASVIHYLTRGRWIELIGMD